MGKVAVITGGGSGMGRAAAFRFAREGVNVCLLDLNLDYVNKVKEQIENAGGNALAIKCDINSSQEVKQGIKAAMDHWGRIDILLPMPGSLGK